MICNAKETIKLQFYPNVYTWTQVKNCKTSLATLDTGCDHGRKRNVAVLGHAKGAAS